MSDYLSRPVYDDVADEARADWRAGRPDELPFSATAAPARKYRCENECGRWTYQPGWCVACRNHERTFDERDENE